MGKGFFWLALVLATGILACGCNQKKAENKVKEQSPEETWQARRIQMVKEQIEDRGVKDSLVLTALRKVPRHKFIPEEYLELSYTDGPLPIGSDQTISQPYIVAVMTELLHLKKGDKVLEIGTGSGYQCAVLCEIADSVYTIEIMEPLGLKADETLHRLGYKNFELKIGDGYQGWPEHAPFDGIIVTAAPNHVPEPLYQQLKMNGKMVIPVGEGSQELLVVTKTEKGMVTESALPVRFVRMTGEAEEK